MFKIFKKQEFSVILLVSASIVTLILFGTFYIMLTLEAVPVYSELDASDKYYLKNFAGGNDPLLTKVPRLEDMLRGPIITDSDPRIGDLHNQVTIVVYSDFKCEYYSKLRPLLSEIIQEYEGDVSLIWKDFPSRNKESLSFKAAVAGRCAQAEGEFWAYHDELFKNDFILDNNNFINIAVSIGLREDDFKECLMSEEAVRLVDDNIAEADALGITGVPFIYINSQEFMGYAEKKDIIRIIDIELNRTKKYEE